MKSVFLAFTLALVLGATGCASSPKAIPSKRSGLFADLDKGGGRRPAAVRRPAKSAQVVSSPIETGSARSLRWPLQAVALTSRFGARGGSPHEGVDLRAAIGSRVYASGDGKVVYAGSKIRGYGKLIVVKHAQGLATVYAHHSQILVKMGDAVKQGQLIGFSGKSGSVSGPHLHFEVRRGTQAVDPEQWVSGVATPTPSRRRNSGRTLASQ